jgi:hypothetical protein
MVKVNMPPVPIVVPVRIMPRDDVIAKAGEALIRLPCDLRTRRLCASITGLRLYVRRMAERREARPCTLKGRSTTSTAHSAKADAASAGTSSAWDGYATAERAAMETTTPAEVTAATKATATARVTATTKPTATESSTSAAMPSRPCHGTERHGCYTDYQRN